MNNTPEMAFVHVWDKAAASEVTEGRVDPAMIVTVGPYESKHLGPEIVGRDLSNGIIAASYRRPNGTEKMDASPFGIDASFWTKVN